MKKQIEQKEREKGEKKKIEKEEDEINHKYWFVN